MKIQFGEPVDTFIASIESIAKTSLQREVAHIVALRRENAAEFMEYVREYGSRQADVIELWWTSDILTFYRHHQHDIEKLLIQDMQDLGVKEISGVFGERWDHNDPFARDKDNRFILAYYGFDRTIQFFAKVIEEAKEGGTES